MATNKRIGYTATKIDNLIKTSSLQSLESLQKALQTCEDRVKNMKDQIKRSPSPLPNTEKALAHWKVRCKKLRVAIDELQKQQRDQPDEDWSKAFVIAATDILPAELFGRIYQEANNYL